MDHKFVLNLKKSAENGQFTMKVIKKSPLHGPTNEKKLKASEP